MRKTTQKRVSHEGDSKAWRRKTCIAKRLTGVNEESEMEIDASDVVSEEMRDDVMSEDEDSSDEKDVEA